ncbi:hypothetical protein Pcaca04_39650 [Pectobacterium carotovorum subsp. carotovorum]|nr:hypothetical protein Pcaca04_39650 [Pectobacterium carotovorum subsp. carotovorum]
MAIYQLPGVRLLPDAAFLPLYPSYFKLHVRWLRSLPRITYLCKLIGIPSLAAFLKLELFRVYTDELLCGGLTLHGKA